jgi:hypothetical protein
VSKLERGDLESNIPDRSFADPAIGTQFDFEAYPAI